MDTKVKIFNKKSTKNENVGFKFQSGISEARNIYEPIELDKLLDPKMLDLKSFQSIDVIDPVIIPCTSKDDFLQCIKFNTKVEQSEQLITKFLFPGAVPGLETADLHKINTKYGKQCPVLMLVSESEEQWTILWKSQEIEKFFELKHPKKLNWEESLKLCEFVADFLAKSLKNNHIGIISQFSYQSGLNLIELDFIADSRDFNLLLLAAETGNTEIVNILLKLKMKTCSMDNKVSAQSMAFDNKHFDVLYILLQNNLTFPQSFESSECSGKLKEFCDVTEDVHKLISSNEKDKLEEILNQHQNLRHFFNFSNKSALMISLESKSFEVFDLLLSKKLRFGSNEDPAEYYEKINDYDIQRQIRDIQNKYSQPFLEKHIHTLVANSTACFDETEVKDKHDTVKRAFELLSQNIFTKIILQIVAASKNFKIVFDFNREAVNVLDPTATETTQGVCYISGKMYIGAKQLLDPATEHETLAVLIHELCHFVMIQVYKNQANPYTKDDKKTMMEFKEISRICEENSEAEEIIGLVYNCYPEEDFHAELIVRVVHLLAFYRNLPEKLAQVRTKFIKLFEFYEKKVVPELQQALPEIESHHEKVLEIKDKKITKFKIISIVVTVVGILGAILVAYFLYKPTYKFNELSDDDQMSVFKAPVLYKGINLEFIDLFAKNSTIYDNLTSDHILKMINKQPLDLTDPYLRYVTEVISHSWENMTEKLKDKVLNSNFTFQDESLKLKKLEGINSDIFNYLTSDQIVSVLDGQKLVVHHMIKNETKFYVERKFENANIREIYYYFLEVLGKNRYYCWETSTKSNKTFESFYQEFMSQNISDQMNIIDRIKRSYGFEYCVYYDSFKEEVSSNSVPLDFEKVLKSAIDSKLFILSGEAGTGKTITFEQLTIKFKKMFPTRWVSYIDLKDYKHVYQGNRTLNDVENMLETIFGLSSKNEFERQIFKFSFKSGNLILFWNGFDEISPQYSEHVLGILSLIRDSTANIQLVCTRPLYSDLLKNNFLIQTYSLIPFDSDEQENYIKKFLMSENIDESKIPNYLDKVQKIVKSTGSKQSFDTPLMLGMITELIASDEIIYESENIYEIYQKFVKKKIDIWHQKSEFATKFVNSSLTDRRRFDMMKLYQSYALKTESSSRTTTINALKLRIMRQKIPAELTSDEISRMGILYINGNYVKFAHRTFAEFFVAQYLIESLCIADDELSVGEAEGRLAMFKSFTKNEKIQNFLNAYIQLNTPENSKPFQRQIAKLLTTKYQKILFDFKPEDFSFLVNFFKHDPKVLKKLLQIDENETLYTSYFKFPTKKPEALFYDEIKSQVRSLLSDDEYDRFIRGKNQKGVLLLNEHGYEKSRCTYCKDKNVVHDIYKLDDDLKLNNDENYVFNSIANNLTLDEIEELIIYIMSVHFSDILFNYTTHKYSKPEQKELYMNVLTDTRFLENYDRSFNLLLNKTVKMFTENEIDKIFYSFREVSRFDLRNSKLLWDTFVTYGSRDMQKMLLRKTNFCGSEYECFPNSYLLIPFSRRDDSFPDVLDIYETYFSLAEIQEIVLSHPSDLMVKLFFYGYNIDKFVEYMLKIFKGNEKSLKDFLLREVEPTNLNAFELLNDIDLYEYEMNNFNICSDLLESLSKY
ncbi:uncharacterized protein [Chironomus tepperi]|uniref:uncharacterized protein n=1 Tax=Chironomus tepperi TaxID=113505 RepID=UPI00391F7D13